MTLLNDTEAGELLLTQKEISQLTGKVRRPAQAKVLNAMGFQHKIRPDGAVIVSRSHIESQLDGKPASNVPKKKEPNWDSM